MLQFILKRSIYGISVLFGVVTLVFFLFALVPDPARELAGQSESEEIVQAIREKYDLDLPVGTRFALFINDLSPISVYSTDPNSRRDHPEVSSIVFISGSSNQWVLKKPYLGRSFITDRNVGDILSDAFPGTIVLALTAMVFALIIGLFLGVVAALNEGEGLDRTILLLSSVGMSGPSFFMAILVAWVGGFLLHDQFNISLWLIVIPAITVIFLKFGKNASWKEALAHRWFGYSFIVALLIWPISSWLGLPLLSVDTGGTGLSMNGSMYEVDVWEGQQLALRNLILPALTLGIRPLAVISQLMRNSVLEVMQQEFIRTAKAKGINQFKLITRHVLRNALNPVITAASGWLASMLAGAVFVEFVFGWKGMGMEVFRSLEKNDLPVVMGAVMVIALIFVVINTLVDILYAWIDPRVRLS
ncbi:ABC transporter permease [Sanyastnella coralliicola]|uniref:ABC transporter permease n=1 Tax=Sanyastnella coralliicola TaxID=3069118 RepID=UPI0027BA883A|nr:ABC transporter permease [Longitalea sp. SCSIO 12813]